MTKKHLTLTFTLSAIFFFQFFLRPLPIHAAGKLHLLDYFTSMANFQTTGHITLRQSPDNPPNNQPNSATLQVLGAAESSIQPRSFLPLTDSLPLQSNYAYSVDFTPHDFQVGDSFDLIFHHVTPLKYYFFRCGVKPMNGFDSWICDLYYHEAGTESLIEHYSSSTAEFGNFQADQIHTLTLTKRGPSITLDIWPQGQAHQSIANSSATHIAGEAPLEPIRFILNQARVASDHATLSFHRFLYADYQYFQHLKAKLFLQTDPLWSDELLGHTTNQTIGDIGCLLTSLVMILFHHGYYLFPDGTQITPSTLNHWLQQQPDGYIKTNLLNIAAVTRLSNQLHQSYASRGLILPKLEYQATSKSQLNIQRIFHTVSDSVNQSQPLILEVPGHFVVADGHDFQGSILVKDPVRPQAFYLGDLPSDPVYSVRKLVPSFTDQSYFIVNIIGAADVYFTGENYTYNQVDLDLQEPRLDPNSPVKKVGHQVLIPKPTSGDYRLTLKPKTPDTTFSFFVYNQDGEVQLFADQELPLTDQTEIEFSYDKTAAQDFAQFVSDEPTWDKLLTSNLWTWQFTKFALDHLFQNNQFVAFKMYLDDYFNRGLINQQLLDEGLALPIP